jgi:hypothetical protein
MSGVRRPVGRKTRRAHDFVLALEQIRAGFEPLCRPDLSIVRPNRNAQSCLTSDAATPTARLKPGAIGSPNGGPPWARQGLPPTILRP